MIFSVKYRVYYILVLILVLSGCSSVDDEENRQIMPGSKYYIKLFKS